MGFEHAQQGQDAGKVDDAKAPHHPRSDREAKTGAGKQAGCWSDQWIGLQQADESEQKDRHCDCKGRILGIHERVPDVKRAGRQQHHRRAAGGRAANAAANAPSRQQSNKADQGADEPPRLEQSEGKDLGGERGQHVEAAAIHVEIDEGECALVGETGAVELEQQIAVLGMGVVVPPEPVVAEGQERDHGRGEQGCDRHGVEEKAGLRSSDRALGGGGDDCHGES